MYWFMYLCTVIPRVNAPVPIDFAWVIPPILILTGAYLKPCDLVGEFDLTVVNILEDVRSLDRALTGV